MEVVKNFSALKTGMITETKGVAATGCGMFNTMNLTDEVEAKVN